MFEEGFIKRAMEYGLDALSAKLAFAKAYVDGKNVKGKWKVDQSCIDCNLCADIAKSNFKRDDSRGIYYVYHQPSTPQQHFQCQEAAKHCPVEAIGKI